jgi:hypothetical protein
MAVAAAVMLPRRLQSPDFLANQQHQPERQSLVRAD